MSHRPHSIEQSTQTDLLYGRSRADDSAVSTLDRAANKKTKRPLATEQPAIEDSTLAQLNAQADAISQNAATRADSSLTSQVPNVDGEEGHAKSKGSRWRYLDGIAPPEHALGSHETPLAVVPVPRPSGMVAWGRTLWRASYASLLSCAVHVVVLIYLMLIVVPLGKSSWASAIMGQQSSEIEPLEVVQREIQNIALPTTVEFTTSKPVTMELSVPELEVDKGATFGSYAVQPLLAAVKITGPVGDVQQLFGALGQGKSQSGDATGGAEFFGAKATGNKFVFVVDCSRSMAGERWQLACLELDAAINRLKPEQLFYVVLFDGGVHRMFHHDDREAALFPATQQNKDRFREWLAAAQLGPETRPFLSVKCALDLHPDAIYLLSDGDFTDPTAAYLGEVNRPASRAHPDREQVVVHTINFHGPRDQVMMKKIARENRGKYIYVGAR